MFSINLNANVPVFILRILPGINDEERLIMLKKGVDYSEQ